MEQKPLDLTQPIVIETKKRKKRKYSSGLKDMQIIGRRVSKVSSRMARSLSKGIKTFRKASDKSARKRRDGALRDYNINMAKGFSKMLRESSAIPLDLARSWDTRGARRLARRQIRATARFNRIWRIR